MYGEHWHHTTHTRYFPDARTGGDGAAIVHADADNRATHMYMTMGTVCAIVVGAFVISAYLMRMFGLFSPL